MVLTLVFAKALTGAEAQGGPSSCVAQGGQFCAVPVGSAAGPNQVVVLAQRSGTVAQVSVRTLGSPGLDFTAASAQGGAGCAGAVLSAGVSTCAQSVDFAPSVAGLRLGAVVLLDSSGRELGLAYLSGTGTAGLGVLVPGNTVIVAGAYRQWTSSEDNIAATSANLDQPASIVFDGAGNLYIADSAHNRIRRVSTPPERGQPGTISTVAGTGDGAYAGDGGAAISASLNAPSGLAIDGAGNLYIADTLNNRIRKVDASTGMITTVAGNGDAGSTTAVGDGGLATQANLNQPQGVTVDANGNLFIADTANQRIRRVDASTQIITTIAGNGVLSGSGDGKGTYTGDGGPAAIAGLSLPNGVVFDSSGQMYISDSANNAIRRVNGSGIIETVAMPGGRALNTPSGVAVDAADNLYIADTQNACVRKLNFAAGTLATLTFNGASAVSEEGSVGTAQVYAPMGLWVDGAGNVYFADFYDMIVEEIESDVSVLNFTGTPVRQGQQSSPQEQTIENSGNAQLTLGAVSFDKNAGVDVGLSTCPDGSPTLAADADCRLAAVFAPTDAGDPVLGNVDIADVSVNPKLNIVLVGDATPVNATVTTLTANPNPSSYGSPVALVATIATGANTGNLTGTVSFFDGTTLIAAAVPVGTSTIEGANLTATASISPAGLTVGTHALTASYDNTKDPTHFGSTSTPVSQLVLEATSTGITSSANPSGLGQNVTLTATVAAPEGGGVVPDGTVTFSNGSTTLGVANLGPNGVATYSTSNLADGPHLITAAYSGDLAINVSASASSVLRQDVLATAVAVVASAPNPSWFGNPVTFNALVTSSGGAVPTGSVNLLDGGRQIGQVALNSSNGSATLTLSSLAVGSHAITASYGGDSFNRSALSQPITQIVNQAQTATAVTASSNPAVVGAPISVSATVQAVQGASSPSGMVQFTDTFNGTVNLGTAALGAGGVASIRPRLGIGAHSIVATYGGDTNDTASSSAAEVLVVQQAVTTVKLVSSTNPSIVETPATFIATVTGDGGLPTGNVTFLADGLPIGTSTLNAEGTASLAYGGLSSGTHAITASYAGDANDQGSTSAAVSQVVGAIPTSTALAAAGTPGANSEEILLSTVAGSSGPTPTGSITFSVGSTILGSAPLNSDGAASFIPNFAQGTYNVVASYSGDPLHLPSASQAVPIAGTVTSFAISVLPSTITVATTQSTKVTVDLTSVEGFSDTIGLGCGSLPVGVTCHFSSPTVSLGADRTQTAQLTIDTNNPLGGGATPDHRRPPMRGWAACLFPVGLFFLMRPRKRMLVRIAQAGTTMAIALVLLACSGGFTQSSAAAGTYAIQVTGTGENSNIIHYQEVTLNITK